MTIASLNGKTVCILGFGREGKAMLEALEAYAPQAIITIADANASLTHERHRVRAGPQYLEGLDEYDVVVKSPGIFPHEALCSLGPTITNSTQIFFDSITHTGALTIGVTGSKGKSTTTSLIHAMLTQGGRKSILAGNIGEPAIQYVDKANAETIFVLELSSYQLMNLCVSPRIAVITSFFPEHLDYHGSLEAYKDAKKNITRFQSEEDCVFYPYGSKACEDIARASAGKKYSFRPADSPVAIEDTALLGEHNLSNIAGAFRVARSIGIEEEACVRALKAFRGLPHRLQALGTYHDIQWVDDAISTTPESTVAALKALGTNVGTIILGGQDRGVDFTVLANELKQYSPLVIILFPGSGPRIRKAIEESGHTSARFFEAESMNAAVAIAKRETTRGMICLLSTASPSYGMFKNFEEKGDAFQACLRN